MNHKISPSSIRAAAMIVLVAIAGMLAACGNGDGLPVDAEGTVGTAAQALSGVFTPYPQHVPFLTKPMNVPEYDPRDATQVALALRYKTSLDAMEGAAPTYQSWRRLYGFAADTPDPNEVGFYNKNDLGLGRRVACRPYANGSGGVACYMDNFGATFNDPKQSLDDVVEGHRQIAHVVMTYNPAAAPRRQVQFRVYGPDGKDSPFAILDQNGKRPVPEVCTTCHGGRVVDDQAGRFVEGAHFIPLDHLAAQFASVAPFRMTDQESKLLANNRTMIPGLTIRQREFVTTFYSVRDLKFWRQAYLSEFEDPQNVTLRANGAFSNFRSVGPGGGGYWTPEYSPIGGRYPFSTTGDTFDWRGQSEAFNVVAPHCMGCHLSRELQLDPNTGAYPDPSRLYESFGFADTFLRNQTIHDDIVNDQMPHAEPTMRSFWTPQGSISPRSALIGMMQASNPSFSGVSSSLPSSAICQSSLDCGKNDAGRVCAPAVTADYGSLGQHTSNVCLDACSLSQGRECPFFSQCVPDASQAPPADGICQHCGLVGQPACTAFRSLPDPSLLQSTGGCFQGRRVSVYGPCTAECLPEAPACANGFCDTTTLRCFVPKIPVFARVRATP